MDILSVLGMVVRHWRVTVPAVLLTIAGVVAAVVLSPPVYQTSGSLVLLNPPEPPAETDSADMATVNANPYLRFNDLSVVADVIGRTMSGAAMAITLEEQGVDDYEVTGSVAFSRGPIIEATARESTPEESIQSSQVVLEEIETVLAERQLSQGADPAYVITVDQIEVPSEATALYGSTIRSMIAVVALGGLCVLGLAILAEAISTRRAARRVNADGIDVTSRAEGDSKRGRRRAANRANADGIDVTSRADDDSKRSSDWATGAPADKEETASHLPHPGWNPPEVRLRPSTSNTGNGQRGKATTGHRSRLI
jgi:hypothetical protein